MSRKPSVEDLATLARNKTGVLSTFVLSVIEILLPVSILSDEQIEALGGSLKALIPKRTIKSVRPEEPIQLFEEAVTRLLNEGIRSQDVYDFLKNLPDPMSVDEAVERERSHSVRRFNYRKRVRPLLTEPDLEES